MIFQVYKKGEPEPVQMIALVGRCSTPTLVGVDNEGNDLTQGHIAYITARGTLHLSVNCKVPGIRTDEDGRIIVE